MSNPFSNSGASTQSFELDPSPPAITTLVIRRFGSLWTAIFNCPLCGEDHWHGVHPRPQAAKGDISPLPFRPRAAHCDVNGPWGYRLVQQKGGDYGLVLRAARPTRHPTQRIASGEYRLVHDGGPVYFIGRRTREAGLTAQWLEQQGFEISEAPTPEWITALNCRGGQAAAGQGSGP
jgi:hypothetical protein